MRLKLSQLRQLAESSWSTLLGDTVGVSIKEWKRRLASVMGDYSQQTLRLPHGFPEWADRQASKQKMKRADFYRDLADLGLIAIKTHGRLNEPHAGPATTVRFNVETARELGRMAKAKGIAASTALRAALVEGRVEYEKQTRKERGSNG